MSDTIETGVADSRKAISDQSALGLILQAHCMTVEKQLPVNIASASDKLKPIQELANNRLGLAQDRSRKYLNVLQPGMVAAATGIQEYFLLHSEISREFQNAPSRQDALALLRALQEQTQGFQVRSIGLRDELNVLRGGLADDAAVFQRVTLDLQTLLNGNEGVLKDINEQLAGIDGKIAGLAVGIALGGLAVIAGGLMFVIGAFGTVFTGGAAVALCVGGGAVAAAGVATVVGSSIGMAGLLNMKSDLLMRQATISAETTLVNSLATNFGTLQVSASNAQGAAQSMANAWTTMGDHLGSLYQQLDKGKTDVQALARVFLRAADGSVKLVLADADTILRNLGGGVPNTMDTTRRVGDMLKDAVNSPAGPHRIAA